MSYKSNSSMSLKQLSKSKETLSTKVSSTESPNRDLIYFEHNAFFLSKLQVFDTKFAESEIESETEDEEYNKSFPQEILNSPKLHYKEHDISIDQISTISI